MPYDIKKGDLLSDNYFSKYLYFST